MQIANTRLKKTILIAISSIFIAVAVIIIFISPIAKYLIEKYDEKITGRQITVGWVYVNPFTGYVHISNLKIHETKSQPACVEGDTIFFSAKGVSANFAMLKLLSKTIEITEITLDQPKGIVIQNKKEFNFTDLVKKFTPDKQNKTPSKIQFSILGIKITDGTFYYREKIIPVNYFIRNVNIESTGKRWNSDTIAGKISLLPGIGTGNLKGTFSINFETGDFRYAVVVQKFDLNIIQQYLRELTNYGSFTANLDADMKGRGNFSDAEDMNAAGMIAINDFHFGKNPEDDYAAFKKLVLVITEISPKARKYLFDSVSLLRPFLKYERYDYLDNIQTMFGKSGSNVAASGSDPAKFNLVIEIARYVKVLAKNFFRSYYKIGRLAIYQGDLKYNDYAISEKFSVDLNPLDFTADSIDKNREWVNASLVAGVKPFGKIKVTLRINPNDSMDFDIHYHLQKLPAAMFNPYLLTYTSFPLDRGTIELTGSWNVREGMIQSNNHVLVIDPRRSARVRNKDQNWLPLPLIMSLVRERGNVIDYEIPITGNLKDPKFRLHDVIMDIIENIFVKPATTSYRLEVKNIEAEIEKSLTLTWGMRKSELLAKQEKFIGKIADYLADNPQASITVYPLPYAEKEKEYILFFEAKKRYYLLVDHKIARSFSEDDSDKVDKMSVKDSLFVRFLNKQLNDSMLFTIQEKCNKFIGSAVIEAKFKQLNREREDVFLVQFKEKAVANRVKIRPLENNIPYNGFSLYKIDYHGELPASVIKAHQKMNELNDESPRNRYKKERKKIR